MASFNLGYLFKGCMSNTVEVKASSSYAFDMMVYNSEYNFYVSPQNS